MQIKGTCTYCGTVEYINMKYEEMLDYIRCSYCNHSKLTFSKVRPEDKIDYYQGSPPFPEKKTEESKPEAPANKDAEVDFDSYYDDYSYWKNYVD